MLSKSSLRSSSSEKSNHPEVLSKIDGNLASSDQTVESLKTSVEIKDAAISRLAHQKECLYDKLKSTQRIIRDLRQQLIDERDIHLKEKVYLVDEIQILSRKEELQGMQRFSDGEQIIDCLQEQIIEKDKIICDICARFLKLQASKSILRKRLQQLQIEANETHETMILLLEENKTKMNGIFEKLLRYSTVSRYRKKYLRILKANVKLHYENVQLKMSLLRNNHSEKSETELLEGNLDLTYKHRPQKSISTKDKFAIRSKPYIKLRHVKRRSPIIDAVLMGNRSHKELAFQLQKAQKSSSTPYIHSG